MWSRPRLTNRDHMTERQRKIQSLSRRNRGRATSASFLARLTAALGESIGQETLMSLEETDALLESFRKGYSKSLERDAVSYNKKFSLRQRECLFGEVECLGKQLTKDTGMLITKESMDAGAVRLNMSLLLKRASAIIRLDGDSLSVISTDKRQGVMIDFNPDSAEQAYEFAVWGDRWPLFALACSTTSQ